MIESKTHFKGSAQASPPQVCPRCQLTTQGLPFCAHDGTIVRKPFTVGGRYIINDLLGSGGTAFVYGGHDQQLGRPVAVKLLRPALMHDTAEAHRFLRAGRLSSQLHHENIVVVHDCGEDAELGVAFLVMERLIGGSLADLRAQSTRLGWERSVRILVQVCRALTESHRLGILHRDLSLRNITLTTSSGRPDVVKLCDFGLARSAVMDDRVTSTGTAVGTPAHMAPEQVRGDAEQDHRVDIYALGSIAYEMLSGRLPHESPTTVAMIASKLTGPAVPLSERAPELELPPGLEDLIMHCLAPDAEFRPESAAEIERQLLALGDVDPTMPRPGSDLVGQNIHHHKIVERLNQGGMGEIYLVEHDVIGTKAALKVLLPEIASNPEAIDRFIQEAKASSNIGSPYIPRVHDFGFLPDRRAYVLMELIEGEPVSREIERTGPLALADVKRIVQQTTTALAAAHERGIIHRDLKPDHIMVRRGPDGLHVKILDFGIAKVSIDKMTNTQVGVFMGTPMYCAPEQVLGEGVGPETDIYSLGATIYEMLTGRPPFSGESGHVLAIKTTRDPASIASLRPKLPASVAATIEKMMARDRSKRHASMAAVAAEVAAWPIVDEIPVVEPDPPSDRAQWLRKRSARNTLRWGLIAAVLVATTAISFALWSGGDSPKATPAKVEPASGAPNAKIAAPKVDSAKVGAPKVESNGDAPKPIVPPNLAAPTGKPSGMSTENPATTDKPGGMSTDPATGKPSGMSTENPASAGDKPRDPKRDDKPRDDKRDDKPRDDKPRDKHRSSKDAAGKGSGSDVIIVDPFK